MAYRPPGWRGDAPLAPRLAPPDPALVPWCAAFEAAHARQGDTGSYGEVGPELAALARDATAAQWRALILWHAQRFEERFAASGLPEAFRAQFVDSLHRVLDRLDRPLDLALDWDRKDLATLRLALIPAVSRLLHPGAGLALRPVLRAGPRAWAAVARAGRRPWIALHVHRDMTGWVTEAGFGETLRLAALLLRARPALRGVLGQSWFYDPAVAAISPRLAYLTRLPLAHGAFVYPLPTDDADRDMATRTSATRAAALAAGRYTPAKHALVWPRRALLAWTDQAASAASSSDCCSSHIAA